METTKVIAMLKAVSSPNVVKSQNRSGINPKTKTLGVRVLDIRRIAKQIGTDHSLSEAVQRRLNVKH